MPDERKLRAAYHALLGQQRLLDEGGAKNHFVISDGQFTQLAQQIARIERECPGVLPPFRLEDFARTSQRNVELPSVRAYLANALGSLKAELDAIEPAAPITVHRDFAFVRDAALRQILQRDYLEAQRAFAAQCWKSVIILSGGAIEALLLDRLLRDEATAKASSAAPREPKLGRWDLADLIKVAVDLQVVGPGLEKLSHTVREYRNLVHPGNELRSKLTAEQEDARIAFGVLDWLHRELSK